VTGGREGKIAISNSPKVIFVTFGVFKILFGVIVITFGEIIFLFGVFEITFGEIFLRILFVSNII
jgi:hypothetical protein